jgi:hypothetical protein
MVYVLLGGAIVAEVLGTTALKFSDGFTRLWPSTITVVMYVISFVLLAQTLKTMAVGTGVRDLVRGRHRPDRGHRHRVPGRGRHLGPVARDRPGHRGCGHPEPGREPGRHVSRPMPTRCAM